MGSDNFLLCRYFLPLSGYLQYVITIYSNPNPFFTVTWFFVRVVCLGLFIALTKTLPVRAQDELLLEALGSYIHESTRLMTYEEVKVEWTMEGTLQVLLNEGINELIEGNASIAHARLNELIEKDPLIWEAYYFRGACRKQLGHLAQAEADFSRVIQSKHAQYESYIELAKIKCIRKEWKEARKYFDKAAKHDPARALPHFMAANTYLFQTNWKDAQKEYQTCLSLDSLFSDAYTSLAIIDIIKSDDLTSGTKHLNNVLRYDSLNRHALLFRAITNFESARQESLNDLNRLILVDPENLMALYLRGLQLSELKNYERAFPDFHKLIQSTSANENSFVGKQTNLDKKIDIQNAGAYAVTRVYGLPEDDAAKIKKAYCLLTLGSYSETIATLNETSNPNWEPLCLYLKAVASEHNGKHNDAFMYYNLALKQDNSISDAYKKRAIYEQELKQWQKSVDDLTEVLKLNSETYVAYKIRGVSYYHLNMYTHAVDDFTRYLLRDSTDLEIIGYRAVANKDAGRLLNADVDFIISGNSNSVDVKGIMKSVDELLAAGDTVNTVKCLDRLVSNAPWLTEAYVGRIKLLIAKNQWSTIHDIIDHAISHSRPDVNPKEYSFLLTVKGVSLSKSNDFEHAMEALDQAIDIDRHNSMAFTERGKVWIATGRTNKAISDLRKAVSLGDNEATVLLKTLSQ